MTASDIIAQIRRGESPEPESLVQFAKGLADGSVSDAQAGAFAMAACLKGLGEAGRVALTEGMRDSGDVLQWSLDGKIVDKHSTGGIGDCTSLLIAPMLAACGVYVPMISGRGLGHTGGTLDKLEAIPGVNVDVGEAQLRKIVESIGCAIVSATGQIAPADKRLYAVRDVTSTVDSIDLITVKVGSGAFMKTEAEAETLANALVSTANGAGCKTMALITDMNEPLAPTLGNALEVAVCMEVLTGSGAAPRLRELSLELAAKALEAAGWNPALARKRLAASLDDGSALERFAQMVHALGGPPDMAEDWQTHLPKAPVVGDVPAPEEGYVTSIDGVALGMAVVRLGGGRMVETDQINPTVGLCDVVQLGAKVSRHDPLATIHAADEDSAEAAALAVRSAIVIGDAPASNQLIVKEVS